MTDHSTLLAKLDLWARSHRERGLPESADLMIAARDAIIGLVGKASRADALMMLWRICGDHEGDMRMMDFAKNPTCPLCLIDELEEISEPCSCGFRDVVCAECGEPK